MPMQERRIIDQNEALSLTDNDYLIADNANLGTRKISFGRLLSGATPLPPNYITGLEITKVNNTSFTVSIGYARTMDNMRNIVLNSSLTKNLNQTFDLGNAGCMPDSLTLQSDTRYYVFAISSAGGVVDIIVDTADNCTHGLTDAVAVDNNLNKYAMIGEIQVDTNSQILRIESYSVKMTAQDVIDISTKTGAIISYAGSTVPLGYLLCNGAEVSRTDYADLFAVIGTIYGAGDGSTTFNLPNFTDRFIKGGTAVGTYNSESLPNIKATLDMNGNFVPTGAVQKTSTTAPSTDGSLHYWNNIFNFNANTYSSTYQDNAKVQPDNCVTLIIIKY